MPISIPNIKTQSQYAAALTLGPSKLGDSVAFSAVGSDTLFQLGKRDKAGGVYFDESELYAGAGSSMGFSKATGIRFRSATPATPANIIASLYFLDDPTPLGVLPVTAAIAAGVSVYTFATWPPANPADKQQAVISDTTPSNSFGTVGVGVTWLLQFSSATGLWSPVLSNPSGSLPTPATVTAALTPAGTYQTNPEFTIPLKGTYEVFVAICVPTMSVALSAQPLVYLNSASVLISGAAVNIPANSNYTSVTIGTHPGAYTSTGVLNANDQLRPGITITGGNFLLDSSPILLVRPVSL